MHRRNNFKAVGLTMSTFGLLQDFISALTTINEGASVVGWAGFVFGFVAFVVILA